MTKEPLELVEGRPMTLTEEARRRAAILRRFDPPGNYDAGLLERQAQTIEGLRAENEVARFHKRHQWIHACGVGRCPDRADFDPSLRPDLSANKHQEGD